MIPVWDIVVELFLNWGTKIEFSRKVCYDEFIRMTDKAYQG